MLKEAESLERTVRNLKGIAAKEEESKKRFWRTEAAGQHEPNQTMTRWDLRPEVGRSGMEKATETNPNAGPTKPNWRGTEGMTLKSMARSMARYSLAFGVSLL